MKKFALFSLLAFGFLACSPKKTEENTTKTDSVTNNGPTEAEIIAAEANMETDIAKSDIMVKVDAIEKAEFQKSPFVYRHESYENELGCEAKTNEKGEIVRVTINFPSQSGDMSAFATHYYDDKKLIMVSVLIIGQSTVRNEDEEKFFLQDGKVFAYERWKYLGTKKTLEVTKEVSEIKSELGVTIPKIFDDLKQVEMYMQE